MEPYFLGVLSLEELLELAAGAELVAPLAAPDLSFSASVVLLEELLELGALGGVAEEPDELEPDGVLGFTVTEPDVELEPDGGVVGVVVAPLPEVDDEDERSAAGRSGPRSQPPIRVAPSARETATAKVENFMEPPWLGTQEGRARLGPRSTA